MAFAIHIEGEHPFYEPENRGVKAALNERIDLIRRIPQKPSQNS